MEVSRKYKNTKEMKEAYRQAKRQYLKSNGWWAHYNDNCWFDGVLDKLYVEDGNIVGFRDKSEGLTLEEAFKKAKHNK